MAHSGGHREIARTPRNREMARLRRQLGIHAFSRVRRVPSRKGESAGAQGHFHVEKVGNNFAFFTMVST